MSEREKYLSFLIIEKYFHQKHHEFFFQEYLARLGIDTRAPHISHGASYQTLEGDMLRGDLSSMVYNRLQDDTMSEKNSLVSGGNNSVYARTGHPVSMTGSLSR